MAVLEQSLKNITTGSEQVQWSYLSPPNLHGITQILLQIAALFAVSKILSRFWFSILRSILTSTNKKGKTQKTLKCEIASQNYHTHLQMM